MVLKQIFFFYGEQFVILKVSVLIIIFPQTFLLCEINSGAARYINMEYNQNHVEAILHLDKLYNFE